jgi:outer membrane protein assembly factor BamB
VTLLRSFTLLHHARRLEDASRAVELATIGVVMVALTTSALAKPVFWVTPTVAPPTTQVLASGSGLPPSLPLKLYFDNTQIGQVTTNAQGAFSHVPIQVPGDALPGDHRVRVEAPSVVRLTIPFLVRTDWSAFGFSPAGGRYNPYENVLNAGNVSQVSQRFATNLSNYGTSSPVVSGGSLYFSSYDHYLNAVDATTGKTRWRYQTVEIVSSATVANGVVYTGSDGDYVYALRASDGSLLWQVPAAVPGTSSPVVVNGVVYVGWANSMFALDAATGAQIWQYTAPYYIYDAPAVANGTVYFQAYGVSGCCTDTDFYAVNAADGTLVWTYHTGIYGNAFGAPAVSNGVVYLAAIDYVYAFNAASGTVLWQYSPALSLSSVAVANGVVYVNGSLGISALDAKTGNVIWTNSAVVEVSNSLAVANGVLYIGSTTDNTFYALDAAGGTVLWTYPNSLNGLTSIAVANGVIYAGTGDGISAFALKNSLH